MQMTRMKLGRVLCATLLALGLNATQALAADEEVALAQQESAVSQETVVADSEYSDVVSESNEAADVASDAVVADDNVSGSGATTAEQSQTSSDAADSESSDEDAQPAEEAVTSEADEETTDATETDEAGENLVADADESVDECLLSSSEDAETVVSNSDTETVDELKGNSYAISSSNDSSYSIGVVDSSTSKSAKAELEANSNSLAQRWLFSDAGDGYVYITNVNSGLVLDVVGGRAASGTKIQQYTLNKTAAQKWRPVEIAEGLYVLVSGTSTNAFSDNRSDWLVLDLYGGKTVSGQSIQIWTYNGSLAQRWTLSIDTSDLTNSAADIDAFASKHAGTLTNGAEIVLAPTSGGYMVLDVYGGSANNGANVQAYGSNSTEAQVWKVSTDTKGFVTLINKKSGKALDIYGGRAVSGTNVQQYTSNGTNAQKWVAVADASGAVTLWSALGKGLVLDVWGGGKTNGTNIDIYKYNGSAAQRFSVVDYGVAASEGKSVADGYYTIGLDGTSLVADVKGASVASGAAVQGYTSNNTLAQVFYVTYDESDGYYRIIDINSHMFLSVGKNLLPGAPVIQEKQNDTLYGQKWNIVKVGSNYRIVSALSSQPLASVDSKKSSQLVASSAPSAQRWTFTATTPKVTSGVYTILSSLNHTTALDIYGGTTVNGARVQGYTSNGTLAQRFFLKQIESSIFTIEAMCSYKNVTVDLDGNITQRASSGEANQNWKIEFTPYGYRFVNQNTSKAISLASSASSTKATQSTGSGAGQSFTLKTASAFDFGCYVIEFGKDTTYVLDVYGGSRNSGANVQIYKSNDSKAQKWFINDAGSGYVTIVSAQSGLQLAVSGAAASKTNVDQETADSETSKLWKMVYTGEGKFSILSALNTGLALDVAGGKAASGTNVWVYTAADNTASQLWTIEKTNSGILIALDPGHGGTDSGAVGNGLRECDLTWSITQACAAKLKDYGYEVYITVSKSEFKNSSSNVISISDRVQRAYNKGATAIFSMHINAGGGNGAVCLVPNSSSYHKELYTQGQKFAKLLLPKINSIGISTWSDGAWERNYSTSDGADTNEYYSGGGYMDYYGIVRYARLKGMLGIIIEHGFIDSSDATLLAQSSIQTKLGQADAWAINELYKSLA